MPERRPRRLARQERVQGGLGGGRIVGRDDDRALAVRERLGGRADRVGEHGQAVGQRLQQARPNAS